MKTRFIKLLSRYFICIISIGYQATVYAAFFDTNCFYTSHVPNYCYLYGENRYVIQYPCSFGGLCDCNKAITTTELEKRQEFLIELFINERTTEIDIN